MPLICKTFTSCWFTTFGIFLNWSLVKLNPRKTCGLKSSLSVFYRTCIYVTEPTRRDIGSSLCAIYQQMQRRKTKTQHLYWWAWVEIGFKEINQDCLKPAGEQEWGHDTGLTLSIILFGPSLNFPINHSLGDSTGKRENAWLIRGVQGVPKSW